MDRDGVSPRLRPRDPLAGRCGDLTRGRAHAERRRRSVPGGRREAWGARLLARTGRGRSRGTAACTVPAWVDESTAASTTPWTGRRIPRWSCCAARSRPAGCARRDGGDRRGVRDARRGGTDRRASRTSTGEVETVHQRRSARGSRRTSARTASRIAETLLAGQLARRRVELLGRRRHESLVVPLDDLALSRAAGAGSGGGRRSDAVAAARLPRARSTCWIGGCSGARRRATIVDPRFRDAVRSTTPLVLRRARARWNNIPTAATRARRAVRGCDRAAAADAAASACGSCELTHQRATLSRRTASTRASPAGGSRCAHSRPPVAATPAGADPAASRSAPDDRDPWHGGPMARYLIIAASSGIGQATCDAPARSQGTRSVTTARDTATSTPDIVLDATDFDAVDAPSRTPVRSTASRRSRAR